MSVRDSLLIQSDPTRLDSRQRQYQHTVMFGSRPMTGRGFGRHAMRRHRRVLRDNFDINYRILSLIVADSNVSLCHSAIKHELVKVMKTQLEYIVRDAVQYTAHSPPSICT
jgi:hypothetical protein